MEKAGEETVLNINDTRHYYRYTSVDLMTEFTICESLSVPDSPYMVALESPRPYGAIIGKKLGLKEGCRVCEVGGGYGSLMKGLLDRYSDMVNHVCMVDLSRFLLKRQRETLKQYSATITFVNGDVRELLPVLSNIDFLIINEMIGDLDTLKALDGDSLPSEASELIKRYGLEIPAKGTFNFNVGAIRIVEEICRRGVPAFISEHSCDPLIPEDMDFLGRGLERDSFPREIPLTGHSEFTIRFSHLIKVAKAWGRNVTGGSLIDMIGVRRSPKMRFIFTAHAQATDEQAILYEFLDHVREYRWLLISE
jgi:hypothetical protein